MAIQLSATRFEFPSVTGSAQSQTRTVLFNGIVQRAVAAVQGFDTHCNNGDRHALQERVKLSVVSISGNAVNVSASFLLRDSFGSIDDPCSGKADAVVIADVAA